MLKIQQMLHLCSTHPEKEESHQAAAVLGIAIIALGEPLGQQMCLRTMDHLLQYVVRNCFFFVRFVNLLFFEGMENLLFVERFLWRLLCFLCLLLKCK